MVLNLEIAAVVIFTKYVEVAWMSTSLENRDVKML